MIKKIKVKQLRPGIFIADFNCNWLHHPFLVNRLKVEDDDMIQRIIKYGIHELYIDTEKGLDITDAPAKKDIDQEMQVELSKLSNTKFKTGKHVSLKEEIVRAKEIIRDAKKTMHSLMEDVRLGKQIELKQVEHIVENMAESVSHNKGALLSLSRIKQKDEYTYMHSVSVCALLIAFAEHLDFDYTTLHAVGVGGLLHDIGKLRIADEILNKPGALSEEEFEKVKEHVKHGCSIIEQNPDIVETSLCVTAHHHEKFNGTGYPAGLKGDDISKVGQMAAIVDVYDALTSDRCYRDKMQPTEALRKLFEWSKFHFNKELVEQFVCCIGIYPIGTLVKLESGLLGIVIKHSEKGLMYPHVRIVYNAKKKNFVVPYDKDLSKPSSTGIGDMVVNFESPEKWNIKPETYL